MKPVRVQLVGSAADEFESLNKTVGEEQANGIQNSERQQLFGSPMSKALVKKSGYPVDNMWVADLVGYWRML